MSEPEEDPAVEKPLSAQTAIELRQYAKDHGLRITHLAQRRKVDLVVLIEQALIERQHST